jgi:hypothetical protein
MVFWFFFAYVFFFSIGSLFALLFRRTLFSYIGGSLALGILLSETLFSVSYYGVESHLEEIWYNPLYYFDHSRLSWASPFLGVLFVSAFFLSWQFFISSEIGNPKRRLRNQLLFGITAAAYLGVVFCVSASPWIASIGSTWSVGKITPYLNRGLPAYCVSPDGRYLAVFESPDGKPFVVRVSMVDTQTGRTTGRSTYAGIYRAYWSGLGQGDVLNLIALNNSPLDRWGYLVPGTVDWIRLSPAAREISRQRLKGAQAIEPLAGGRAVAVKEGDGLGRVLLLDGASGRSSEVARAPLDGRVALDIDADGQAALVYFVNELVPRKAWTIDPLAQEIKVPRSIAQTSFVLFGELAESRARTENILLRRYGAPLTPGGVPVQGQFIVPFYELWILTGADISGLYFLEDRQPDLSVLWARSTSPEGRWRELTRNPHPPATWGWGGFFRPDFASGTFAGVLPNSGGKFFVYDPRIDKISTEGGCAPGERFFLDARRVLGLKGIFVRLTCWKGTSAQRQTRYFEYLPGSGKMRAVRAVVGQNALVWDLYMDEQGRGLGALSGKNEEVWSSVPGKKDLLLWSGRRRSPQ